jgi:hypothetical protein
MSLTVVGLHTAAVHSRPGPSNSLDSSSLPAGFGAVGLFNPLADVLGVPARTSPVRQVTGGLAWSLGITIAGYVPDSAIPGVDQYLLPVIALIAVVSVIPIALVAAGPHRSRIGRSGNPSTGSS